MKTSLYSPLKSTAHEIRLLHLRPGTWHDPISCELKTVSLDDNPTYDALSYVWGACTEGQSIEVDGCKVKVTDNLFAALRRMRLSSHARVVWIDQLVINQEDLVERSQQVLLMGRVYSQSTMTLLWLGEEPDLLPISQRPAIESPIPRTSPASWAQRTTGRSHDGAYLMTPSCFGARPDSSDRLHEDLDKGRSRDYVFHAFELVNRFADWSSDRHVHMDGLPYFQDLDDGGFGDRVLRALDFIMRRPWWNRVWTYQEAVLPPAAVVAYGPLSFPILGFTYAGRLFTRYSGTCCSAPYSRLSQRHKDILQNFFDTVNSLYWAIDYKNRQWKMSLELALHLARNRQSTDPRDQVFGVLGLPISWEDDNRREDPIFPDYQASIKTVYQEATLKILRIGYSGGSSRLSILGRCIHNDSSILDLPSWAVNWSCEPKFKYQSPHSVNSLACGRSKIADLKALGDGVLSFKGVHFDSIRTVAAVSGSSDAGMPFPDLLLSWQSLAAAAEAYRVPKSGPASEQSPSRPRAKSWQEAFWRTICLNMEITDGTAADSGLSLRSADASTEASFVAWCRDLHPQLLTRATAHGQPTGNVPSAGSMKILSFDRTVREAVNMKRLFLTRKGYLGLGPWTLAAGDRICILHGGAAPFVLRSCIGRESENARRDRHELVGECYVEGVMDGEAMEMGLKEEYILLG